MICLVPALAASAWLYLWFQWALPTEGGGIEVAAMLAGAVLSGVTFGIARDARRRRLVDWALKAAALVGFGVIIWPPDRVLWYARLLLLVPATCGYLAVRLPRFFANEVWLPFAVALVPLLFVLSTTGIDGYDKQAWPWRSFQPRLFALRANAENALDRLHLPRDRALTKAEYDAWARETPLRMELRVPVIGRSVTVSIVDRSTRNLIEHGYVQMWWGYDTFGLVDPRTMHVVYASD